MLHEILKCKIQFLLRRKKEREKCDPKTFILPFYVTKFSKKLFSVSFASIRFSTFSAFFEDVSHVSLSYLCVEA